MYENKLKLLPQELNNMRKNETCEKEDHWNNHISALMEDHDKTLSEVHEFINYMQQDMDVNELLKVLAHTFFRLVRLTPKTFLLFRSVTVVESVNCFYI